MEKFIFTHSGYKIGNKLWLTFEKQIGLLLAAKKELTEAVDIAIATKLLPSMSASIKNLLTKDDETLKAKLEFIFGEENISFCSKFIDSLDKKPSETDKAE